MTPAERITIALGGRWSVGGGVARCPCHDDKTPSLSIRDGAQDVIFHCFSGCSSLAIVRELLRRHLMDGRHDAPRPVHRPHHDSGRRDSAIHIWRAAHPASGTIVETYLRGRGITLPVPPTLRHHGSARYAPTGLYLDAMICAVQAQDRSVIAVHRTFLSATGRKAPVSSPKMALGALADGAVRLGPADEVLGLGEGVETCLSAQQIHGVTCWATLGAERLSKIGLPPIVRKLILFGDRGAEAQVDRVRGAYEEHGLEVEVRFPDIGKDFNDQLQAQSAAA